MSELTYSSGYPIAHEPNTTEQPKVSSILTSIRGWANAEEIVASCLEAEGVTLEKLSPSVQEELKNTSGTQLEVAEAAKYTVPAERLPHIEYKPNAARPVFVVCEVTLSLSETTFYVREKGTGTPVEIGALRSHGIQRRIFSFFVPPESKWYFSTTGGEVYSTYLTC